MEKIFFQMRLWVFSGEPMHLGAYLSILIINKGKDDFTVFAQLSHMHHISICGKTIHQLASLK